MKMIPLLSLLAFIFCFYACSESIGASKGPPLKVSGERNVAIPEAAFGKEYMLSTSVIPQAGSVTGSGQMGRVVYFEVYDDAVDLYESTKGQVVTEDLAARRLLASFPIVSREGNQVVIDFNQGMRRLLYKGWYSMSSRFDASSLERSAELPQARVFEVSADNGKLVIRQSVQARSREFDRNRETRMEVRYFISPYEESDFEAKEMNPFETRYARFWETQPQLELTSGRQTVKMGRFDESEPIVFHYSANTPDDYVDAVKEGILYWNRAFGSEIVEAEEAPEGVTAPDANYNVIQWVPWDSAGFAYADVLLDPRTGEALHGQAFMTSVFGISGIARARALLRSMTEIVEEAEESKDDEGDSDESDLKYSLFGSHTACRMDPVEFAKQLSEGLEELLADPELTDEAVMKLSQDYVRHVTAHEVGHVLGLRHNFAGSLAATLSPKELDTFIKDYVAGEDLGKYEGKSSGSSSMEYSTFKASVFSGWQMKREGGEAHSHDKGAIRWGYFDDKTVVEEKALFGTDQDTFKYGDVNRFDYGAEPLLASYREVSGLINQLPNSVIEVFIRARAPQDPRDRRPLETVSLSTRGYASGVANSFGGIMNWFKSETRSLRVENDFDYIGELNLEERQKAHWEYLNSQLETLGGVDRVLFSYLPVDLKLELKKELEGVDIASKINAEELGDRLEALLETDSYSTFVGLDDETYTWTEDEKKIILERGRILFAELEESVLLSVFKKLEKAPRDLGMKAEGSLKEEDAVAKLEKRIVELANAVVLERDKERRIGGKVDKALVEVMDFKYKLETRIAAGKALNDKTGSYASWSKEAKNKMHADLKKAVEDSLNIGNFKKFEDKMLSRSLRQWYLDQQQVLKLLPPGKKSGPPSGGETKPSGLGEE